MTELKQAGGRILYSPADARFDMPCLYAVVGDRGTLMIDGGVSADAAREFVRAVHDRTGRGVDYAAVTHWHWDHTFGLAGIGAPVIACANTRRHLLRLAGYGWSDEELDGRVKSGEEIFFCARHIKRYYPNEARGSIAIRLPDVTFEGSLSIDLGGVTCELTPIPTSHTDDCVTVWAREEKALFVGDAMGPDFYASPVHYTARDTLALFRFIRELKPDRIFQSHSEPETMDGFIREDGILEVAAKAVRNGCTDREDLIGLLRQACGGNPPEDIEDVAAQFINGLKMPAKNP